MAAMIFTIVPDEFPGLSALIELDWARRRRYGTVYSAGAVSKARTLMRAALADKLEEKRPALGTVRGSSQEARRRGRRAA